MLIVIVQNGTSLLTPQVYKMCIVMKSMGNFITKLTSGDKENDIEHKIPFEMDEAGHIGMKK